MLKLTFTTIMKLPVVIACACFMFVCSSASNGVSIARVALGKVGSALKNTVISGKSKKSTETLRNNIPEDTTDLIRLGTLSQISYDVFCKSSFQMDETPVQTSADFWENSALFEQNALCFKYVSQSSNEMVVNTEYDLRGEYEVVGHLFTPRPNNMKLFAPDKISNWSGFMLKSKGKVTGSGGFRGRELVLVWRGTQTAEDWAADVDYFKDPLCLQTLANGGNGPQGRCKVHKGFQAFYTTPNPWPTSGGRSMEEFVAEQVRLHYRSVDRILVTGHSLGGALATLSAFHIAKLLQQEEGENKQGGADDDSSALASPPVRVINFASPKVGDEGFNYEIKRLQTASLLSILRVANDQDIVPKGPPDFVPKHLKLLQRLVLKALNLAYPKRIRGNYVHNGEELLVDSKLLVDQGIMQPHPVAKWADVGPCHNMELYLKLLDPSRDDRLLEKSDQIITAARRRQLGGVSPCWHFPSWPRWVPTTKTA